MRIDDGWYIINKQPWAHFWSHTEGKLLYTGRCGKLAEVNHYDFPKIDDVYCPECLRICKIETDQTLRRSAEKREASTRKAFGCNKGK